MSLRNLVLVLGDQLDLQSAAFAGFDAAQDLVWLAEFPEESEHAWSHKARTALFLTAMRHFGQALEVRALPPCATCASATTLSLAFLMR